MIEKYLRKFRLRSFFVRIFLAHVIVLSLLLGVFYFYISNLFSQHYAERVEAAVSDMLRNSCTAVDVTLLNMVHSMRQTLENQNMIRAMVTPNLQDYPRTVAIVGQLRSAVAGNILVRAAALCVPTGDSVFSFDGTVTQVGESAWEEAVDAYREGYRSTAFANGSLVSHVRVLGERIFVYQDFFPEHLKNIGTLIFEIDVPRFYEMIFENDESERGCIYLFDDHGAPVFPGILDYARVKADKAEEIGKNYLQRSSMSGWTLRYLPSDDEVRGVAPVRRVFFPFALAVLLLSLPLSLYASTRVYRPMKRLMTRISPTEGGPAPSGNELDYLDRVYSDAKDRNERLHSTIAAISPAVLERLFQNLLLGREVGRREIEETLVTLAAPFVPDARYTVLLLSLVSPDADDEPPSEVEVNLCTMAVRERLGACTPEGVSCCALRIADATLALVVSFDDALTLAEVQLATGQIRGTLRAAADSGNERGKAVIGQGEVYAHIEDLRFSYLEALEDLHHSRFYGEEEAVEVSGEFGESNETYEPDAENMSIGDEWAASSLAPGRTYFSKRCGHILQSLNEGDSTRASDILRRVVGEIFADTSSEEETAKSCGLFADCLLETLVVQKGSGFKQISKLREELDVTGTNEMDERLLAFGERIIAKIRSHSKKRSKRYIRAAEEYIESNFSDASLSLNMAAEHVGLNASYFSRLFGEATGRHFTDYLGELRVEKACELLAATDMPIKDVAYRTGFNSMQNYFRVFKKCKGMTPGEYRGRGRK